MTNSKVAELKSEFEDLLMEVEQGKNLVETIINAMCEAYDRGVENTIDNIKLFTDSWDEIEPHPDDYYLVEISEDGAVGLGCNSVETREFFRVNFPELYKLKVNE